jgi:hypothetical protein
MSLYSAIDRELLWDELKLDSLIDDTRNASILDNVLQSSVNKQKSYVDHQKMISQPNYAVLMDRYGSTPHDPTLIHKKRLDTLADPIRGRYSTVADQLLPHMQSDVKGAIQRSPSKNTADRGNNTFFLTEADEFDENEAHQQRTVAATKSSFANNFRNNVSNAAEAVNRKMKILNNKHLAKAAEKRTAKRKMDPLMRNLKAKPRKGWEDTTTAAYRADQKKKQKKENVIRAPPAPRKSNVDHAGGRKIVSSGYGAPRVTPSSGPQQLLAQKSIRNPAQVRSTEQYIHAFCCQYGVP